MIIATVDPLLARALASVESSRNQWALRFEPVLYARAAWAGHGDVIARIVSANHCSVATAEMIFCSSFGLYQIMGENLYSRCNVHASVGEYLATVDYQNEALAGELGALALTDTAAVLLADPDRLDRFAAFYNGPGDVADYAAQIRAALAMGSKA